MLDADSHLGRFAERRQRSAPDSVESIVNVAERFVSQPDQLPAYDARRPRTSILLGQVQSGKTGHYLGIAAMVADRTPRIRNFLLLTQSLVALQQQTLADARDLLPTFEIFDENDEVRFRHSLSVDRPRMVVLKKVTRPLRSWLQVLNPLALGGQPLFIIDDEADATGQNTRVNQNDQSEINRLIDRLVRDNAAYMLQVTATPQAVLLQDSDSLFRPQAQLMFSPGPNYLGGDFFFPLWTLDGDGRPFHLVDTDEEDRKSVV